MRPKRPYEGFRVAHHQDVWTAAEEHGGAGPRQAGLRSGTSIGANYREAHRGRSKAEFIAKVGDSLRELEETAYWLELLIEGKIVAASKLELLRKETDELTAIFVTILKRSKES